MASCNTCGNTILFGGKKMGQYRFCSDKCLTNGRVFAAADEVPYDVLMKSVEQIHQGSCPKCNGHGPVDVHTSHTIYSMLLMTSWKSNQQISCRPCGVKTQAVATLSSLLLGWWGFPWGILMTPVQIVKNIAAMVSKGDPSTPSAKLEQQMRLALAKQALNSSTGARIG